MRPARAVSSGARRVRITLELAMETARPQSHGIWRSRFGKSNRHSEGPYSRRTKVGALFPAAMSPKRSRRPTCAAEIGEPDKTKLRMESCSGATSIPCTTEDYLSCPMESRGLVVVWCTIMPTWREFPSSCEAISSNSGKNRFHSVSSVATGHSHFVSGIARPHLSN